jgi:hypothetical protein
MATTSSTALTWRAPTARCRIRRRPLSPEGGWGWNCAHMLFHHGISEELDHLEYTYLHISGSERGGGGGKQSTPPSSTRWIPRPQSQVGSGQQSFLFLFLFFLGDMWSSSSLGKRPGREGGGGKRGGGGYVSKKENPLHTKMGIWGGGDDVILLCFLSLFFFFYPMIPHSTGTAVEAGRGRTTGALFGWLLVATCVYTLGQQEWMVWYC